MIEAGTLVLLWSPERGDTYLVRLGTGHSQGTHLGNIKHETMMEASFGDAVTTHLGKPFYILRPTLADFTLRLKRRTQIIYPKEAGYILTHLRIFPGARVVECGTGSGSLTCTFAHFVGSEGHVFSYDRSSEFSAIAQSNLERWGVADRATLKVRDLAEGFDEHDADAVFLDLQNPWDFIVTARSALAFGGRLGILVPTFNQVQSTLEALRTHHFVDHSVVEILVRPFKINPARLRPEDTMVAHTGYLIFASSVTEEAAQLLPWLSREEFAAEAEAGVVTP